jgi:hypothetical protein
MINVLKHGKKYSGVSTCPFCECVVEFSEDSINSNGFLNCPECKEYFKVRKHQDETYTYVRNEENETDAINECLDFIDFEEFYLVCQKLYTAFPETYDNLSGKTPEELKQLAIFEIMKCFELMEKYAYTIKYKGGGISLSYSMNGFYSVETFYDIEDGTTWCSCKFSIAEGGVY